MATTPRENAQKPASRDATQAGGTQDRPGEKPPAGYVLDQQIGFLLRRAHQRATGIFAEHMSASHLTPPQFSVLVKLHEYGEVSQNQLGRLVDIDRATIQGIVSRLQHRKLIKRLDDPNHKSRLLISLSAEGKLVLANCLQAAPLISEQTLAPLTIAEQLKLQILLEKLITE